MHLYFKMLRKPEIFKNINNDGDISGADTVLLAERDNARKLISVAATTSCLTLLHLITAQ